MKSYQDKIMGALEAVARKYDVELVKKANYSNVGILYAMDGFNVMVELKYEFDQKTLILFNGAQHGPPGPNNYYFDVHEGEVAHNMLARWEELIKEALEIF